MALAVVNALDKSGIPYMIVGSLSSNMYGIPRSTLDADFVIQLGDKNIQVLMGHLEGHPVFAPSPEDVIVTKLLWAKRGVRQKDVD